MDRALEEINFGKANGACGIFMRGFEGERLLSDSSLFPVYDEAQRLDVPICVHAGTGDFGYYDQFSQDVFSRFKLPSVGAFNNLIYQRVPEKFPSLRWSFVETTSQWIPYAIHDLARRHTRRGKQFSKTVLKDKRVWVTCQTDDDLDYILGYAGEDSLVIGTDYGHSDNASEIEALRKLRNDGKIPAQVIDKILDDNPRALYAL